MKLRIKGNTMRLRVSRSEVASLLRGGRVEDAIQFSASPESRLTYGLQTAPQARPIEVEWRPQNVTVSISHEEMKRWGSEAQTGVYANVELGSTGSLAVAIEKDFACLDGSGEKNADSFENPNAACA